MDVFETIKENITETGKFVAEKAKLAKDILVVRDQIRNNKKQIRTLTFKIGQAYIDLHAEDAEDAFADFIRGINEAKEEMASKETELEALKEQLRSGDGMDIMDEDLDEFFAEEEADEAESDEAVEKAPAAEAAAEETAEEPEKEADPDTTEE